LVTWETFQQLMTEPYGDAVLLFKYARISFWKSYPLTLTGVPVTFWHSKGQGVRVGASVGLGVGAWVGAAVGFGVGDNVGRTVGADVGIGVGAGVGVIVGAGVIALVFFGSLISLQRWHFKN
jgi:drug/metabolite transporter (DMT)-like permease